MKIIIWCFTRSGCPRSGTTPQDPSRHSAFSAKNVVAFYNKRGMSGGSGTAMLDAGRTPVAICHVAFGLGDRLGLITFAEETTSSRCSRARWPTP
jgi:hypothetical protein